MASIGGQTCTYVHGTIPVLRETAVRWRVPGIDGYGITQLGLGDGSASVQAVLYGTEAVVNAWAALLYAMQSKIVEVVNDHGDASSYCFLDQVHQLVKTAAYKPGTFITVRGEIRIDLTVTK